MLDLVAVVLLILVGGFFAASEIALITVKRHRLDQLAKAGSGAARTAHRLTADPNRFLATIQVAITFLGFLAGATGAAAFSAWLAELIRAIPLAALQPAADEIAFVVMTLVIALASIIVGELVPKTLALSFPERLALLVARPIGWVDRLLSPVVWTVSAASKVLVRLLGGKTEPRAGYLSTEELKMLVAGSAEEGALEEEEKERIHGAIELGERTVREVMVPRVGIHALDVAAPPSEALATILRDGHSRLPVFEESVDGILGILYTKDLLPYLQRAGGELEIDFRALLRQPAFVPETKRIDELLQEMRAARGHMAIVVDEYGGTAGLVTLEDIVEEIVGEIEDEYDAEEPKVERIDGGGDPVFRLHGRLPVDDLRDLFGLPETDEPDEDSYQTVAGLVVHRLGTIPAPGAEVPFRDGVVLRVETSEPRRVTRLIATRRRSDEVEDQDT